MMARAASSGRTAVEARLAALGILTADVEERFVASSKPGGQNVNKTATCVWLIHRPSGVQVKAQSERSQLLNRAAAWERLVTMLERRREMERKARTAALEKARRQKRKRSEAAKKRMLETKRRQALKKADRRRVTVEA